MFQFRFSVAFITVILESHQRNNCGMVQGSLVSAPAFSSRTEVLWMAGYSPGYPVNASENGDFI